MPSSTPSKGPIEVSLQPQDDQHATPPHLGVPQSTPITKKVSGSKVYASEQENARDRRFHELSMETQNMYRGPMPPEEFLESYLKVTSAPPQIPASTFKDVPKGEVNVAPHFITAVSPYVGPEFKFVHTGSKPDTKCSSLRTDISLYKLSDSTLGYSATDPMDSTNFARMDLFVELKPAARDDAFRDSDSLEAKSRIGALTRGQLATYAAAQMTTQFRTHVFSVLICGHVARFIRWDRAGAVVTKSFDYVENPHLLARFFWSYARLPSNRRGYDSTVSVAPDANRDLGSSLPGPSDLPLLVLEIPTEDEGTQSKKVLVRRPGYSAQSPFGRVTKAMRGMDLESQREVFVKDYWRPDVGGMEKEGDIYRKLHEHNVRNIASFYCGNDIRDQGTITQDYEGPGSHALEGFQHYRMALREVGRPLTEFKSTCELVNAIADAMEGHQDAFDKAKILHRDISVGNIVIKADGKGMLIDWDLSVDMSRPRSLVRRLKRTGTWQFISAALLDDSGHIHELADDRESAFWVLYWVLLRYTKHNLPPDSLADALSIFDETRWVGGAASGGRLKTAALLGRKLFDVEFVDRPTLHQLIRDLVRKLSARYSKNNTLEILGESASQSTIDAINSEYDKVIATLKSDPQWQVKTLRDATSKGSWPTGDGPVRQVIGSTEAGGSGRKYEDDGTSQLNSKRMKPQYGYSLES